MKNKRPNTKRYSISEPWATVISFVFIYLTSVGLAYTLIDGLEFINNRLEQYQQSR